MENQWLVRCLIGLQHGIPQHGLTRLLNRIARIETPWFKNLLISKFVRIFKVDLSDAEQGEPAAYKHFNQFFTRPLKPGTRPLANDPSAIVSPVDGYVSQIGQIQNGTLLQAKDRSFSLQALLAGDTLLTRQFSGGSFATLYLAPHNYHRIHMPCDGCLQQMTAVPGKLFSVGSATVAGLRDVFARNERLICCFETGHGPLAVIMVGALNVGSIDTVWQPNVTPCGELKRWEYDEGTCYAKGTELGRFNFGSTVILLFAAEQVTWNQQLTPHQALRMGETIATLAAA